MIRTLFALAATLCALASAAPAQTPQAPPSLDPAGVSGVRFVFREDAVAAARGGDYVFDWRVMGVAAPKQVVTVAEVRRAFEGNALQAERRFAEPFIVSGALQSASRRADRAIVVGFKEGGVADGMRRAFPGPGLPDLGDMTGGLASGGAQAVLPAEYAEVVADWNPGATVALLCASADNVRLAVLLKGCMPQATAIARAERAADVQVELALARRPLTVPVLDSQDSERETLILVLTSYGLGLSAKACREAEEKARIACAERRMSRDKRLTATVLQQTMRDLQIQVPEQKPPEPRNRQRPGR